jgi:hypothetical protein
VGGVDKAREVSTVSRRQLKTDDEWGFLLAFWDEVRDLERDYDAVVTWDIRLSSKRGVISIHGRATGSEEGPLKGAVIHAQLEYPSASVARLHAALYSAGIRLSVGVSHEFEDRTGLIHPLAPANSRKAG